VRTRSRLNALAVVKAKGWSPGRDARAESTQIMEKLVISNANPEAGVSTSVEMEADA
jgi:hypothetical protein